MNRILLLVAALLVTTSAHAGSSWAWKKAEKVQGWKNDAEDDFDKWDAKSYGAMGTALNKAKSEVAPTGASSQYDIFHDNDRFKDQRLNGASDTLYPRLDGRP